MSVVEQKPAAPSETGYAGVPWQIVATWALGAVTTLLTIGLSLVCWVFLSTTGRIEQTIKEQGSEIVAIRKQLSDNQLQLVEKIDAVDKNVAVANGRIDAVAVQVGAGRAQTPPAPLKQ